MVCSHEDLAAYLHVEYGLRSDLIWPERHARCIAAKIGGGSVHMKLDGGFKQIRVKTLPRPGAKAGDGGVLLRRSLLEDIAMEKLHIDIRYLRGKP